MGTLTPLDLLPLNILPVPLRSNLLELPLFMQATIPMDIGAMVMDFPSLLPHLLPPRLRERNVRPQLIPQLMPGMDTMAIPDIMDIDITDMVDTMDIVMDTDTGAARRGRLTPPSSPHLQPSLPLKL